jgi:REP element-mobilizing transposase RayT
MGNYLEEHLKVSFFTATTYQWKLLLKPIKYKRIIIDSLKFLVDKKRIRLYGFVIMPNHIHLLLKILPPWKISEIQRDCMKFAGQQIKFDLIENNPEELSHFKVSLKDRKYQFWQRNSFNKLLEDRAVVEEKLDYIHNNPVQKKWLLAKSPADYHFSSYKYYEFQDAEFDFLSHYMECFE